MGAVTISIGNLSRHLQARGLTRRGEDGCNRSPDLPCGIASGMTQGSSLDAPHDEAVTAIVDASDARVFRIDRAMRLTWANRATRERHGLGERMSGSLSEVFDAPKRAVLLRPLQRALAGSSETLEWRAVDADGRPCWTLASISPDVGPDGSVRGCVVVCIDATAQHRADEARHRGEDQKRSVLDNLPDLVWTARADGSTDWFNHRWTEYSGRSVIDWSELMPAEDRERARDAWAVAQHRPAPFTLEVRLRRHDGELRWHLLRMHPLRESVTDPSVWGWCGSCTDIDHRKQAEVMLRTTQQRISAFLGALNHELRNPLASLAAAIQIMRHPRAAPGMVARALDTLERQTGQLARMVDELLDATRLMDGRIDLQVSEVSLDDLVREIGEDLGARAAGEGVQLECELPAQPVHAQIDSLRIRQAVANLVINALQACRGAGSVTIGVLERGPAEVGIRVADTGCGLTTERLAALFEPGAGSPLRGSAGGLGLGLKTARHIVELHGGRLVAESAGNGQGASFELLFPRRRAETPDIETLTAPVDLTGQRVLVIGDLGQPQLLAELERRGAQAVGARGGIEGLRQLARGVPTVLVCDLDLPAPLSGYDVLREVDRIGTQPRPRMIAIGASQDIDIAAARTAGFDDCLIRPVATPRLLAALAPASTHRVG
jgi:PAS domain S-box-containing protein